MESLVCVRRDLLPKDVASIHLGPGADKTTALPRITGAQFTADARAPVRSWRNGKVAAKLCASPRRVVLLRGCGNSVPRKRCGNWIPVSLPLPPPSVYTGVSPLKRITSPLSVGLSHSIRLFHERSSISPRNDGSSKTDGSAWEHGSIKKSLKCERHDEISLETDRERRTDGSFYTIRLRYYLCKFGNETGEIYMKFSLSGLEQW